MLKQIPLDYIVKYYSDFYNSSDGICVVDINQLKLTDEYLKEENLEILKDYATLKILTEYARFISEGSFRIYQDYYMESQNDLKTEDFTADEIRYMHIYTFFRDTITEEFAKKYFTKEQKEFYTNLIKEEIDTYKTRIMQEDWLTDETKKKALAKMENMSYTVGVPEVMVKVENKYNIDTSKSYIANIINVNKNIKYEELEQL